MGNVFSRKLINRFTVITSTVLITSAVLVIIWAHLVSAITQIPTPSPKPGSFGLEATKKQAPPKTAPTISNPGNGSSSVNQIVTVSGICQTGLLIEVYNNKVMAGSTMCKNGSFSVKIGLFIGTNDLTAIGYDDLGQASPVSNKVRVNFNPPKTIAFGDIVTLTSTYGRRASAVGKTLSWPLELSGGSGPYALSIDWGDGSDPQLKSQAAAGNLTIEHVYEHAGIYTVTITATDSNGVTAFLQVVAVASGEEATLDNDDTEVEPESKTIVLWLPAALTILLLVPAYWLGRRSQLTSLRRQLERERDAYNKDR